MGPPLRVKAFATARVALIVLSMVRVIARINGHEEPAAMLAADATSADPVRARQELVLAAAKELGAEVKCATLEDVKNKLLLHRPPHHCQCNSRRNSQRNSRRNRQHHECSQQRAAQQRLAPKRRLRQQLQI